MSTVLFSTNCPKCKVLEQKLTEKNVDFTINSSVEDMQSRGFLSAPMLEVDGKAIDFSAAVPVVNGFDGSVDFETHFHNQVQE